MERDRLGSLALAGWQVAGAWSIVGPLDLRFDFFFPLSTRASPAVSRLQVFSPVSVPSEATPRNNAAGAAKVLFTNVHSLPANGR